MIVAFPIIIIVLFAVVGFSIAFTPIIKSSIKKSRCKYQLKATIIDVHWKSTSNGGKTYVPTYQYFYAGKEYIATSYSYNGVSAPEIGSHIDILINENNPEDYYIEHKVANLINLVFGLMFAVMAILIGIPIIISGLASV